MSFTSSRIRSVGSLTAREDFLFPNQIGHFLYIEVPFDQDGSFWQDP